MLSTSITYFNIEVADLFDFEAAKYLSGERSDTEMQVFLSAVEDVIFTEYLENRIVPFANSGEPSDYYYQQIESLFLATKKERIRLAYFHRFHQKKDLLFEYNHPVELRLNDKNFVYWLFLKIRQFEDDLLKCNSFLELNNLKFYGNTPNFRTAVKLLISAYRGKLSEALNNVIASWVNQSEPKEIDISANIETVSHLQFKLKILRDDPKFFSEPKRIVELFDIFKYLKSEFLDSESEFDQFKWFLGISTKNQTPIVWKKSNYLLRRFIELLSESQLIINLEKRDTDTWKIAARYFNRGSCNAPVPIENYTSISKASGKECFNVEKLKSFVSTLEEKYL